MADAYNYRSLILKDLKSVPTFSECYPQWHSAASKLTGNFTDSTKILDLGSNLRAIFLSTRGEGRSGGSSQSEVAKAGAAWETLVVWYLNLVFSGSRAIAVRKNTSLVPECILDAIAITYGNFQTNSESDVLVIAAPKSLSGEEWTVGGIPDNDFFKHHIHKLEVGVLQCKTNWNENAQIPMLWDMVYRLAGTQGDLSVGRGGYSTKDFAKFTYSFVTAPTQALERLPKSTGMPAKRVRNLSGGNYWGLPTRNDVALSFKEIFTRNFASAFDSNVAASISGSLKTGNPFILDQI